MADLSEPEATKIKQDPSKHLRPCYMTCVICRRHITERVDLVFAVLCELGIYLGYTKPFVPVREILYDECTIYIYPEVYSWLICQRPNCRICSNSPDAFLSHLDCFELVSKHIYIFDKKTSWDLIPSIICSTESFFNAWPKARSDYRPLPFTTESRLPHPMRTSSSMSRLPQPMQPDDPAETENRELMKRIASLPAELLRMVEDGSAKCILWRLFAALEWPKGFAEKETETRQLKDLGLWRRSSPFGEKSTGRFVVLGIDDLGLKEIRFFDRRPADADMTSIWYVLLETVSLGSIEAKWKDGHLHLSMRPKDLTLWDTPNIPDLSLSYFAGAETNSRFRTISLKESVAGLTFFVDGGLIYAIHVHYGDQASSALKTYLGLCPRWRDLVWIFVPLKGLPEGHKIDTLWLRYKKNVPSELAVLTCPSLVIRTRTGRIHTIGLHCSQTEACRDYTFETLGSGSITHLIYTDPDLGKPILKFGACASQRPNLRPPRRMPEFPNSSLQEHVYFSRASLYKVHSTTVFYEKDSEYCRGVLLQYEDGDEQVLGQCRDDLLQRRCLAPFSFSYKCGQRHVQVQFHSECDRDKVPYALGYHVTYMDGTVLWWFDCEYDYVITKKSTLLSTL